jgi:hypothetical protein
MPGLQESLNRTTLQPRTDSSDSFANTQMSRDMHNDGEKEEELVVRNAGFVESARDEEIANQNRNMESSVNAMNANSQNNAAEANLVAQKVQARAQYKTLEQQRGRLANAAVSGISDLMKSKKSDQLTKQFNDAAF